MDAFRWVESVPIRRLAFLGLAALLLLSPLAAAGSQNDPESDDGNDDVEVNGATCAMPVPVPPSDGPCLWSPDFIWANVDIDMAWVNDTADALVFTVQMKAGTAFTPEAGVAGSLSEGAPFDYAYQFAFTIGGNPFVAIATMARDGEFALSGVASAFLVHDGNRLTLTVPKDTVGEPANGAVIGSLVFTAHGADDNGNTLDDRAPDAEGGRDYTVTNGTAPGTDSTGNLTAPASNSGSASQGPAGPSVVTGTSTSPHPTISGSVEPSSTSPGASSTGSGDGSKESPALPAVASALALVALVAVLRRRL
jgi:hypothetical protein